MLLAYQELFCGVNLVLRYIESKLLLSEVSSREMHFLLSCFLEMRNQAKDRWSVKVSGDVSRFHSSNYEDGCLLGYCV